MPIAENNTFPHKQQQRQASSVAPHIIFFYVEHFSKALKTKDGTPLTANHSKPVKGRQHFLPSRTSSYNDIFDPCLCGILFSAPSLTKASRRDVCAIFFFFNLKKSYSVDTLENNNYSKKPAFDILCHRNYYHETLLPNGWS